MLRSAFPGLSCTACQRAATLCAAGVAHTQPGRGLGAAGTLALLGQSLAQSLTHTHIIQAVVAAGSLLVRAPSEDPLLSGPAQSPPAWLWPGSCLWSGSTCDGWCRASHGASQGHCGAKPFHAQRPVHTAPCPTAGSCRQSASTELLCTDCGSPPAANVHARICMPKPSLAHTLKPTDTSTCATLLSRAHPFSNTHVQTLLPCTK